MNTGIFHRVWRIIRIPLAVIVILFLALVIYRIPAAVERQKTKEAIDKIQAQKLTLADVLGKNLPPEPDPTLKDATVEGIDANGNGIRDDVELAIFNLHPDSAKIRAAELQYAMELQTELTQVFNSETLVATIQQEDSGFFCIGDAVPAQSPNILSKEVEKIVFDTPARAEKHQQVFKSYMTSYKEPNGPYCDVDLASLPN